MTTTTLVPGSTSPANADSPATTSASRDDAAPTSTHAADGADQATVLPFVDGLVKRATRSAHEMVDNVAGKVSAVAGGLQGGVSSATDTRDEWVEAARDAIRRHPFATVAGAALVGAALLSLRSRNR